MELHGATSMFPQFAPVQHGAATVALSHKPGHAALGRRPVRCAAASPSQPGTSVQCRRGWAASWREFSPARRTAVRSRIQAPESGCSGAAGAASPARQHGYLGAATTTPSASVMAAALAASRMPKPATRHREAARAAQSFAAASHRSIRRGHAGEADVVEITLRGLAGIASRSGGWSAMPARSAPACCSRMTRVSPASSGGRSTSNAIHAGGHRLAREGVRCRGFDRVQVAYNMIGVASSPLAEHYRSA